MYRGGEVMGSGACCVICSFALLRSLGLRLASLDLLAHLAHLLLQRAEQRSEESTVDHSGTLGLRSECPDQEGDLGDEIEGPEEDRTGTRVCEQISQRMQNGARAIDDSSRAQTDIQKNTVSKKDSNRPSEPYTTHWQTKTEHKTKAIGETSRSTARQTRGPRFTLPLCLEPAVRK